MITVVVAIVMNNIYGRTHAGAIFAPIDAAFETASQSGGTVAVALNVNVTYISTPDPGSQFRGTARRVSQSRSLQGVEWAQ